MTRSLFTRLTSAALALGMIALASVSVSSAASACCSPPEWITGVVTLPAGAPADDLKGVTVRFSEVGSATIHDVPVSPIDGSFESPEFGPGLYLVEFRVGPYDDGGTMVTPDLLPEYFDDARTPEAATLIDLNPDSTQSNTANATLDRPGSLSGTVTLAEGLDQAQMRGVRVSVTGGNGFTTTVTPTFVEGAFEVDDVPPGDYLVSFDAVPYADSGDVLLPTFHEELFDDVYYASQAKPVTVTGDSDTGSIDAELGPARSFATTAAPTVTYTSPLKWGTTLVGHRTQWTPTPSTYRYQWNRDGKPISGATASKYTVATADFGSALTLTVTAAKPGLTSVSRTSAPVKVPRAFTAAPTPTISGTAASGRTLTAKPGAWSPTATLSYQWYRNGAAIPKATSSTYKVTSLDKGKKLTVKVTAKRSGYFTKAMTSAAKTVAK